MSGYVDAHHHLWVQAEHPQPWIDPGSMAAIARDFDEDEFDAMATEAGVTSSVVVQSVNDAAETGHLLRRAARSAVVSGVVGWADLTAPDLADQIARWRGGPGGSRLVGLRHVLEAEPDVDWLRRPPVLRGLRTLGECGVTFDLVGREPHLPAALAVVAAAPETSFVLDHLAKPSLRTGELATWGEQLRLLAAHPNVTAKISGLVTEADWSSWRVADLAPAVAVAVDAFGPDRLMVGSDWPVCLLAGSYDDVVSASRELIADLSEPERHAILEGTARRVYGGGHTLLAHQS
ncbi:amidohydrolase family protein [Acidothermaceae bacterium B102]|nr:amidohydrolase family protein [Acidothermaceae bacterium B102]